MQKLNNNQRFGRKKIKKVDVLGMASKIPRQVPRSTVKWQNVPATSAALEDILDFTRLSLLILPLFALPRGVVFSLSSLTLVWKILLDGVLLLGLVSSESLSAFLCMLAGPCVLKWLLTEMSVNLQHVIGASLHAGIGSRCPTFYRYLGFEWAIRNICKYRKNIDF